MKLERDKDELHRITEDLNRINVTDPTKFLLFVRRY